MRVLFFAQLKDITGCETLELSPASPLKADELWTLLLERFPELKGHRSSIRLARNGEYAMPEAVFNAGDEVALIPPVSGG